MLLFAVGLVLVGMVNVFIYKLFKNMWMVILVMCMLFVCVWLGW